MYNLISLNMRPTSFRLTFCECTIMRHRCCGRHSAYDAHYNEHVHDEFETHEAAASASQGPHQPLHRADRYAMRAVKQHRELRGRTRSSKGNARCCAACRAAGKMLNLLVWAGSGCGNNASERVAARSRFACLLSADPKKGAAHMPKHDGHDGQHKHAFSCRQHEPIPHIGAQERIAGAMQDAEDTSLPRQ